MTMAVLSCRLLRARSDGMQRSVAEELWPFRVLQPWRSFVVLDAGVDLSVPPQLLGSALLPLRFSFYLRMQYIIIVIVSLISWALRHGRDL